MKPIGYTCPFCKEGELHRTEPLLKVRCVKCNVAFEITNPSYLPDDLRRMFYKLKYGRLRRAERENSLQQTKNSQTPNERG